MDRSNKSFVWISGDNGIGQLVVIGICEERTQIDSLLAVFLLDRQGIDRGSNWRDIRGVEGAKNAFFKGEIEPKIKSLLLFNYSSSNLPLTKKDIDFIISDLEAYIKKSEPWIQKTKKDDYEEDVIACLESFLRASETSTILCQLRDDVYEKLSSVCSEVLKMKIIHMQKRSLRRLHVLYHQSTHMLC